MCRDIDDLADRHGPAHGSETAALLVRDHDVATGARKVARVERAFDALVTEPFGALRMPQLLRVAHQVVLEA